MGCVIGSLECVRCKARRSEGPETYIVWYFEDHARLRTQQMMCYSEPRQNKNPLAFIQVSTIEETLNLDSLDLPFV